MSNAAVSVLLKHNTVPDPAQDPFGYLWIVNCTLYSVIVAFYISKDWKKGQWKWRTHWKTEAGF